MSIWQTKKWQEMLLAWKQIDSFFEVNSIFVEKRKVSLGEYWLFVIWNKKEISKVDESLLVELCKKEKCIFIQIESIHYGKEVFLNNSNQFKEGFYKKFIPPYTAVINLEKSEKEILSEMKPKGRYNIGLARKKWVSVSKVEKTKENIDIFVSLMQETTSRDNFFGNTFDYYKTFLERIESSELFLAFYEWKSIASWIFVFEWDIAYYYYWASSNEFRNIMSPYLVQWEAIIEWKKRGCKIYDFLGISSPWEKNSQLAWVTDFKLKLTGDSRKVSESIIWINKKWKYRLIQLLKIIKRAL